MPDTEKKPVFLFYGEDFYSSAQKLKSWKKGFIEKYGDINSIETIDGKELKPQQFITNLEAVPFLCEKRLIIIKDYLQNAKTEDQKKIAEAIEKTPDFCVLVFHENGTPDRKFSLYKKIAKIGHTEEFKILSPPMVSRWIADRSKKIGLKIQPKTITYLANYSKTDLFSLTNELEKLKFYAADKEITVEMINSLITPSLSSSIFRLTDSVTEKNTKEALKTLKILRDSGEELTKIFFMLVRHFRILLQVDDMIKRKESQSGITKTLKQHPFVIKKAVSQCKNFTTEKLEKIYRELLKIDIGFKTGIIKSYQGDDKELNLAIEKLIIEYCR